MMLLGFGKPAACKMVERTTHLRIDEFDGQFHVLDVRLVDTHLDGHSVKHMQHHPTRRLSIVLKQTITMKMFKNTKKQCKR